MLESVYSLLVIDLLIRFFQDLCKLAEQQDGKYPQVSSNQTHFGFPSKNQKDKLLSNSFSI